MANQSFKIRPYRGLQVTLEKALIDKAEETGIRIRAYIRDELNNEYKRNVKDSYEPIGERGKAIADYNKKHKHKKAANYHHTGVFYNSIGTHIKGNKVVLGIDKNAMYEDGTPATLVYKWLTQGTRKRPKYPYYPLEGAGAEDTPWVKYVPTPKHNFNQVTSAYMNNLLSEITQELEDGYIRPEIKHRYMSERQAYNK